MKLLDPTSTSKPVMDQILKRMVFKRTILSGLNGTDDMAIHSVIDSLECLAENLRDCILCFLPYSES
jgi:hypothetical protein